MTYLPFPKFLLFRNQKRRKSAFALKLGSGPNEVDFTQKGMFSPQNDRSSWRIIKLLLDDPKEHSRILKKLNSTSESPN